MKKYHQISISQLVDTFSRIESSQPFDFKVSTSERISNSNAISKNDIILASVNDKIYYSFIVIDKTNDELKLKKIFEIQNSINHTIDNIGIFNEISESEYNSICVSLFEQYNKEISLEVENFEFSETQIPFDIIEFQKSCAEAGLIYSSKLIHRFIASLLTKPFLILTGLSGSGKTKLAQAFVQWISENKDQYRMIPVGADWTNREPLLGYPNALNTEEYIPPENGALELIIEASKEENKDKPYFLILDEMNLSHVERYFADFLSTMESKEGIPLHPSKEKELSAANSDMKVPWEIKLPENLFIIGTVNIDETTHMFSPKVLDRANTIEFRISTTDLEKYFARGYKEIKDLNNEGRGMGQNFVEIARGSSEEEQENKNKRKLDQEIEKKIADELKKIFGELSKIGAEFGYRTASEILKLCGNLEVLQYENILAEESGIEYKEITDYMIDVSIMQKLLPKVHGSRRQLSQSLIKMSELCYKEGEDLSKLESKLSSTEFDVAKENCKYPMSLEKIARMYRAAINNGFASFAEA